MYICVASACANIGRSLKIALGHRVCQNQAVLKYLQLSFMSLGKTREKDVSVIVVPPVFSRSRSSIQEKSNLAQGVVPNRQPKPLS